MTIRYRIMLVMVALIAAMSIAFTFIIIEIQKRTLLEGIDRKLLTAATMATEILPEHYHDDITDSTSVSREEYLKIADRYTSLCKRLDIQYIWSLMEFNGKVVFTSGSSTGKDISKNDFAPFFDIHTNPDAYEKAFRTMRVQYSTFHDKWGAGRMVVVPAFDHHGRKYLFAASMELNEVNAALFKTSERALFFVVLILAIAIILSFLLANSLSQPIVQLTRFAENIARENFQQSINVRGGLELRSLSDSINFMSQVIRDKIAELQVTTESLNTTLNSIGDGVIATDTAGRVTLLNPAAEHLTGWTCKEARGIPLGAVFCIINTQTRQPADDPVAKVLKSGKVMGLANHTALISRNGMERQIADSAAPIRDKTGRINGAVLVFHDVTREYKASEALAESEERFRQIYDNMADGVAIYRAVDNGNDFVFKDINPAGEILSHTRRPMIIGHTVTEVFPGVEKLGLLDVFRRVWQTGTAERLDQNLYQDSNITQWVENYVCKLPSGLIAAIYADTTKRRTVEEALRISEEKFSKSFLFSPNIITLCDLETDKYIEVNEGFLGTFGYRREEVIGHSALELGLWVDREDREKVISRIKKDEVVQNLEVRFRRRNGEEIFGLLSMGKVELSGRTVLLSVSNDLTYQKRTERELREKSDVLNTVLQVAPVGIALIEDQSIRWTNDAMLSLFGYSREEIYNRNGEMLCISPEEFGGITEYLAAQLQTSPIAQTEATFRRKDGSVMYGLVHMSVLDSEEPMSRAIATFTDITWKKRAEEELTEEKERLMVTLRSIGDAVIATDIGGKVVLMNRVAEELTGWSQKEALGNPLHKVFRIINEKTRSICVNPVEIVLESGVTKELAKHSSLISRDGIERSIEDSGACIRDAGGAIIGVVLVFRDITVKRRMEEELQKTQNLESVGVLAGGIAHDFNNILTGLLGNISLAKLDLKPEHESYPILSEAEEEALRARSLTQQLMNFSKGGGPIRKIASISDLLHTTVNFALRGSNVRCEFNLPDNLRPAEVDEGQFCQVISNLVINAAQAMPHGGVIRVKAKNIDIHDSDPLPLHPGMYIHISVADQGDGIAPEHLLRIFDPYFSTKENGHGLGLATSISIIRKHNGHIRVESQPGNGATFHIYLPAIERRSLPRASIEYTLPTGSEKILIMDDEETIRFTTRELLARSGYTVETAREGAEAVEMLRTARETDAPFSLVIMDLTVPGGMGGSEALSLMKEFDPGIKAIVSSGYSGDPVIVEYTKYGFDGAVIKPYRFEDLVRLIRSIIDK